MANSSSVGMPRKPQRVKSLDQPLFDGDDEVNSDFEIDLPLKTGDGADSTPPNTRRKRHGSKSPSASPDPAKPSSIRSLRSNRSSKSRSQSPRTTKEAQPSGSRLPSKSPSTPKTKSASSRSLSLRHSSHSPSKSKKSSDPQHRKSHTRKSSLQKEHCHELPKDAEPMLSFEESMDDIDSVPGLVDHSVIRETMEGNRNGREWNIQEDSPGGHADEKLILVPAIEADSDSQGSEVLDEDDDIIEDPDDHSLAVARIRRISLLPSDPSSLSQSFHSQEQSSGRDRFDPSFNNDDRWKESPKKSAKNIHRFPSGDVSVLSDYHGHEDLESVSEQGSSTMIGIIDAQAGTPEVTLATIGTGTSSKTLGTTKQSGSYRPQNLKAAPDLEDSIDEDNDIIEDSSLPACVPEDSPLDNSNSRRRTRRSRKQPAGKNTSDRKEQKGSSSTGRSSQRRSAGRGRKERDALHGKKGRRVPDVIPTTPNGAARSPLSSAGTLTPNSNSLLSSLRSRTQKSSLEALGNNNARSNKPLNLHVGRGRDISSQIDGDEHTLGASTITTNFSSTQRTRGDNTVSTRSLFQSHRTSDSETPRIPMRRGAGSDYECSDEEEIEANTKSPPKAPQTEADNLNLEHDVVHEWQGKLDDPFNRVAELVNSPSPSSKGKSHVRRPSGGGKELIEATNGDQETGNSMLGRPSDKSLGLSSSKFDRKAAPLRRPSGDGDLMMAMGMSWSVGMDAEVFEALHSSGVAGADEQVESLDKFDVAPTDRESRNIGIWHAPDSPTELLKKKKKKKKGGLFRLGKSWKGVVALDDDEDVK